MLSASMQQADDEHRFVFTAHKDSLQQVDDQAIQ
jgi:hypothetical protein